MTLREIYQQIQGDYDSVISRLRDEERVKKHLVKFVNNKMDTLIHNALAENDFETAFREAAQFKGGLCKSQFRCLAEIRQ